MPFTILLGLAGFASAFTLRAIEPTLALIAAEFHVSFEQAAMLSSGFALPYALMQIVFGPIGDAVGKVRVMRVNLAMLTLCLVACALAPSHDWLMAARIVAGAWAGGIIPVSFALVGDRVAFADRPAALGKILTLIVLGQLCGSVVSGLIATQFGWRAVLWLAVGLSALAGLGVMAFITEEAPRGKLSFRQSLMSYRVVCQNPISIRLFIIVAIEGALVFGCFPIVAAHMLQQGFGGPVEAGLSLGAFGIGGLLYTLCVTPLVRAFGLPAMSGAGAVLAAVAYILIGEVPHLGVVIGLFALAGFGFQMLHNMIQILATELVPAARGASVALYATSFWLGQAIGAAAASQALPLAGSSGLFLAAGIGLLGLIWPAIQLARSGAVAR